MNKYKLFLLLLLASAMVVTSALAQEDSAYSSIAQNSSLVTAASAVSSYPKDSPLLTVPGSLQKLTVHNGDIFSVNYLGFYKTAVLSYGCPDGTVLFADVTFANPWWQYRAGVPAIKQIFPSIHRVVEFQAVNVGITYIDFTLNSNAGTSILGDKLTYLNTQGPSKTYTITVTVIP